MGRDAFPCFSIPCKKMIFLLPPKLSSVLTTTSSNSFKDRTVREISFLLLLSLPSFPCSVTLRLCSLAITFPARPFPAVPVGSTNPAAGEGMLEAALVTGCKGCMLPGELLLLASSVGTRRLPHSLLPISQICGRKYDFSQFCLSFWGWDITLKRFNQALNHRRTVTRMQR